MHVSRQKLLLFYAPLAVLILVVLSTGGILSWVWGNAEKTTAERLALTPSATVGFDLKNSISEAEFVALVKVWESQNTPAAKEEHTTTPKPKTDAEHPAEKAPKKKQGAVEFSEETAPPNAPSFNMAVVDNSLIEISPFGPLPKIGKNGDTPWQAYRAAFTPQENIPQVVIIIDDVGLSEKMTVQLLRDLPKEVTFAFNPYAQQLDTWLARARGNGHETLMGIPMEPKDYPQFDPGPKALMKDYSAAQNADALKWALGRAAGYVGVISIWGDAFTEASWRIDPVLRSINKRGLLFVDATTPEGQDVTENSAAAIAPPYARVTERLDSSLSQNAMKEQLADLEKTVKKQGSIVVIASPYPVVLSLLKEWIATFPKKKLQLTPVSVLAEESVQVE